MLEELETELTGDPIEIAFNAKYITDVIRNITDENCACASTAMSARV